MTFLFTWLANFISGPLLHNLVLAYKAKLAAGNTTDGVLADVAAREILVNQRQRELDVQMNIADQGNWFTRTPRALVQWSLGIYISKVVIWDIVLGLGSTPSIHDPLVANAFNLLVAMWFGGRTIEKTAQIITNRIGKNG